MASTTRCRERCAVARHARPGAGAGVESAADRGHGGAAASSSSPALALRGAVSLGNPDRPIGGLAVPRPMGVELRPLGRDDFADALALARELSACSTRIPSRTGPSYEALVGDVDATPFLALADDEAGRAHRPSVPPAAQSRHLRGLGQRPVRAREAPRARHRSGAAGRGDRRVAAAWRAPGRAGGAPRAGRPALRAVRGRRLRRPGQVLRDRTGPDARHRRPPAESRSDRSSTTTPTSRRPPGCSPSLGGPLRPRSSSPALRRTYAAARRPRRHRARCSRSSTGRPVGFVSLEFRQPFFTTASRRPGSRT